MMRVLSPIFFFSFLSCQKAKTFYKNWELGNIVCAGNSLTFGFLLADRSKQSYPAQLGSSYVAQRFRISVLNKGVNGMTTQQMIAAAPAIDALYKPGVKSVCIAWEIGNDIWFNGTAGPVAYSNFVSYCLARKAKGWFVVVITVPPRNATSAFGDTPAQYMAKVNSANGLLLANGIAFCDVLVNINSIPELATVNPVYYFPDNIHLRENGYRLLVDLLNKKIFTPNG